MASVFSADIFTNKLADIISVGFCDDFNDGKILEYSANMGRTKPILYGYNYRS